MRLFRPAAFAMPAFGLLFGAGVYFGVPEVLLNADPRGDGTFVTAPGAGAANAPLPASRGKVLLTVSSAIGAANAAPAPKAPRPATAAGFATATAATAPKPARFDDAMLAALPRAQFTTSTIWTSGETTFSGVPLQALLKRLGVAQGRIRVIALNDYAIEIPVAELEENCPLLADRRDGKPMSIRDNGPLWLVYPYDSSPDYRNEVIYARSVWQVDRIVVLP